MVRDNRHGSASIFGAICQQRGVGAAMPLPAANTAMMHLRGRRSATVWNTHDDINDACETAWNRFIADQERIASTGTIPGGVRRSLEQNRFRLLA